MKILVLGSSGQLGRCLKDQLANTNYKLTYISRKKLDITNLEETKQKIVDIYPNVIINTAAYTNVDKAEENQDLANEINHIAVANIANVCSLLGIWLIHISTDYIFDGSSNKPYKENDKTNPQGVYGKTKYMGELAIKSSGCMHIIIRTSWIFSEYGNNFLKTMLSHGKKLNELRVVSDQIGCPTYAQDIAITIVKIIPKLNFKTNIGTYHYCGYKSCSWFDFANEIFLQAELKKFKIPNKIDPIKTSIYKTSAKRPTYSALNCAKICTQFNVSASNWHSGIIKVLDKLEI